MERFVRLVVAGGLTLVAGLWIGALLDLGPLARLGAALVALAGAGAVLTGIQLALDRSTDSPPS